jgi:hypothetical protein
MRESAPTVRSITGFTTSARIAALRFAAFGASLFLLQSAALAASYHVAQDGKPTGTGTADRPFSSIALAAGHLQPGDTCWVHDGIFRETIRPAVQGSAAKPLMFVHAGDKRAVISGCDRVTGWKRFKGSIYKAPVGSEVSQVFVNGRMISKATYPNVGDLPQDAERWAAMVIKEDKTGTIEGASRPKDFWKGAIVVSLCGSRWVTQMGTISESDGASFIVTDPSEQWIVQGKDAPIWTGPGVGFITGTFSALDTAGEWHWRNDSLYLWAPGGGDPAGLIVEARVRQYGLDLRNSAFVRVQGIDFKAASADLTDATGCVVDRCTFRYPVPFFTFKNGFGRDNHLPPQTWVGKGVAVSGSGNAIRNCYIAHSWGDGVSMWGKEDTLENCIVEDCDWMAIDCAPVCVTGLGHVVRHNTLLRGSRSILVHRQLKSGRIEYNDMGEAGLYCTDLGLTYCFKTGAMGTTIAHNRLHDNLSARTGPGIYLDNWDTSFVVHHNVIWNCGLGIAMNNPSINFRIYNNTIVGGRRSMTNHPTLKQDSCIDVVTWNNLSDQAGFEGTDQRANLRTTGESFVDPAHGDFRLKQGSPAIDAGEVVPGITDGFAGTAPDIGAYEFGGPGWTAGATTPVPAFDDEVPAPPSLPTAESPSWSRVVLRWTDNAKNEDGFMVERKGESGRYAVVATLPANASVCIDNNGLTTVARYWYRIRAFNRFGGSLCPHVVAVVTASDGSIMRLDGKKADTSAGVQIWGPAASCHSGDWMLYRAVSFAAGFTTLQMRLAVPKDQAGARISLHLDSLKAAPVATLITAATSDKTGRAGSSAFAEQSVRLAPVKNSHDVYFSFAADSGSGIGAVDWFQFAGGARTPARK